MTNMSNEKRLDIIEAARQLATVYGGTEPDVANAPYRLPAIQMIFSCYPYGSGLGKLSFYHGGGSFWIGELDACEIEVREENRVVVRALRGYWNSLETHQRLWMEAQLVCAVLWKSAANHTVFAREDLMIPLWYF